MSPSSKEGYIYKLIDPRTNEVRYVGQTIVSLQKRLNKHISDSFRKKVYVACWIQSLVKCSLKPIIKPIEMCEISLLDEKEVYYINEYRNKGFNLTNISPGGQSKKTFSEETKMKISKTLTGQKQSDETKKKRSMVLKKIWENEELRELKRLQTTELNRLGVIGTKGMVSKKKGLPFQGDRNKLSTSLKEYYKSNIVYNKKQPDNLQDIISDYKNDSFRVCDVAEKYNMSKTTLVALMRRSGVDLRKKLKNETI